MTQGSMETFLEELFNHVTNSESGRNNIEKAERRVRSHGRIFEVEDVTCKALVSTAHAITPTPGQTIRSATENKVVTQSSSRSMVELQKKLHADEQSTINSAMTNLQSYSKERFIQASSSSDSPGLKNSPASGRLRDCLVDGPSLSYIALISLAIQSVTIKRMLLAEIYDWIENNFPQYQRRNKSWKNSIRHNLSLNECFVKSARSENGKGHYWCIHPANVEQFARGDFRRRYARRRAKQGGQCGYSKTNLLMKVCNDGPETLQTKQTRLEEHPVYCGEDTERLSDCAQLDNKSLIQSKSEWYQLTNSCRYTRNYIPMTCTVMSTEDLVAMFGVECVLP